MSRVLAPLPPPAASLTSAEVLSRSSYIGSVSFLVSLVIHLSLLLVLAVWVWGASSQSSSRILLVQHAEASPELEALVAMKSLQAAAPSTDFANEPIETTAPPEVSLENVSLNLPELSTDFDKPLAAEAFWPKNLEATRNSLAAAGKPAVSAKPVVKAPLLTEGASYYGIHAAGQRFVFVVDSSTSMHGVRWDHAIKELLDSLRGLPSEAEFYLMFFSTQTRLLFDQREKDKKFQVADTVSIQQTSDWIAGVSLGNSTRPHAALRIALEMEPDAIFLLSDGEFRDDTLSWLRTVTTRNRRSGQKTSPIHTIGLFSNSGLSALSEVAQRTGGQFRQIRSPF